MHVQPRDIAIDEVHGPLPDAGRPPGDIEGEGNLLRVLSHAGGNNSGCGYDVRARLKRGLEAPQTHGLRPGGDRQHPL